MTLDELETPAVTIDLDRLDANIRRVQKRVAGTGRGNRPHIKTHKIPAIAKMQMEAGAVGITCQKLGEVEVFVDAGVADDILITFNIVGRAKTDHLMQLASRVKRLAVVADNETVVRGLSEAGVRHGADVPLLIECDTGFGRNGVQSPEAARVARPARHEHAAHPLRRPDDLPQPRGYGRRIHDPGARPLRRRQDPGAGRLGRRHAGR